MTAEEKSIPPLLKELSRSSGSRSPPAISEESLARQRRSEKPLLESKLPSYNPSSKYMKLGKRLIPIAIIFPSIIAMGCLGFHMIEEDWTWTDALYMSIITVTTVGFSEVHPLSSDTRVFTAILILVGVGGITYTFSVITDYLIAGELQGFLRERRMKRVIDSLTNHYLVCGYGEMGRQVCIELAQRGHVVVVIDGAEEAVRKAREEGYHAVQGDAGLDSVLEEGGIRKAGGLVVATDDDATNLLVVLTARVLRSTIPIVARANLEEVIAKLQRAGADRVLFPQSTAGRRMAMMLLNPDICDFLDVVSHDDSLELLLENFQITEGSELEDQTLRESRIRELTGASVVGLKRPGEGIVASLKPATKLQANDIIFAMGTREQIQQLAMLVESKTGKA